MNRIHGHIREFKGWALESWGTVIHDPWLKIAGRRERLLGSLEASLSMPMSTPRPDRNVTLAKPRF
jgi:uncharacterized protein YjbJ (UPF0337 family)